MQPIFVPDVERHIQAHALPPVRPQRIERRPGRHADAAMHAVLAVGVARVRQLVIDVTVDVGLEMHLRRRGLHGYPRAVDAHAVVLGGRRQAVDELDALGVVWPDRDDQMIARVAVGLGRQPGMGGPFDMDALGTQTQAVIGPLHPRDDRQRRLELQRLLDVLGVAQQQRLAIGPQQPAVDRPAIVQRCQQPARIDDGQMRAVRQSHRGPVAVREIHVGEGECPRHERWVGRVELAHDPVGPDPIQVVLDCPGVHQAAGVEDDAGAQQLGRLGDLGRLRETAHARRQHQRVDHAIGARRPANDPAPRQPAHSHRHPSIPLAAGRFGLFRSRSRQMIPVDEPGNC
jgi:hypothetical protein